jgi:hypothetical protein
VVADLEVEVLDDRDAVVSLPDVLEPDLRQRSSWVTPGV